MKLYFAVLSICLIFNAFAMETQHMSVISRQVNGPVTKIYGVIAQNNFGGKLECEVSYNSHTNIYSGDLINNRFDIADWDSHPLKAQKAQEYFEKLKELK